MVLAGGSSVDEGGDDPTVQLKSPAWALKLPALHATHRLWPTCGS
jgi:hypothetical protein